MDQFEIQELIFEVSRYRSDILKDIDGIFARIKKDNKDLAAKKELVKKIEDFTGIKDAIITIKPDYMNAAVVPLYDQVISADLINILRDYDAGENIRNLEVVEEPSKYIKKIYVILGVDLINTFSPRELTAILLHELGHVYTYTSNLPRILLVLFQKFVGFAGMMLKTPILLLFNIFSVSSYLIASLIVIMTVRTLTFLEHKTEYRADQFAAKYGYGDELVKVLYKLHNKFVETEKQRVWYEKMWNYLSGFFTPSTHPPSSSRIKELNDKMLEDYKKMYPHLTTELNIILKDIKT